jgi:hypothetical protein
MGSDPNSYAMIKKSFNTCRDVNSYADVYYLMTSMSGNFGTMAMVNYPYETSFTEPLPANPVNYAMQQVIQYKVYP